MLTPRRWPHRAGFYLLKALARLSMAGGFSRLQGVGETLGSLHYRLGRAKRRKLLTDMARLMPERGVNGELRQILSQAYQINNRAIIEIIAAYSGALTAEELASHCSLRNIEALDQIYQAGSGLVLLGMHMGNGIALAVHLAQHGYPISVVYKESQKISPGFFLKGIQRNGMQAVPASPAAAGFRQMLRTLRSGGILFILMDQASKKGGVRTRFLGKQLDLPPGPAELARRTGAPIVPALLEGTQNGWQFGLGQPLNFGTIEPLEQQVRTLAQLMESHILSNPQWWTWHQRRWGRYPFER